MKSNDIDISIVGLGRLGLGLAIVLASRGFRVVGVDLDAARVAEVNAGKIAYSEPTLPELMQRCAGRLSATRRTSEAVERTSVTFVLVQTPTGDDGSISARHLLEAVDGLGRALASKQPRHLVVVSSTVSPGTMLRSVRPQLEAASGKRCGEDLDLCYGPEFVALGAVAQGYLSPSFTLVGELDRRSGDRLLAIYEKLCTDETVHLRMGIADAEIAKLALNLALATKISFANFIAQICERLPGSNVDHVMQVVARDPRIGRGFLTGGPAFGGKCFPRDVQAMIALASATGVSTAFPGAVAAVNERRLADVLAIVLELAELVPGHHRPVGVGILGLAFKPGTDETAASQGLQLARDLATRGLPVFVHDPIARMSPEPGGPKQVADAQALVAAADVLVVATPWPEYAALPPALFREKRVLDCWRTLVEDQRAECARYVPLGFGGKHEP